MVDKVYNHLDCSKSSHSPLYDSPHLYIWKPSTLLVHRSDTAIISNILQPWIHKAIRFSVQK